MRRILPYLGVLTALWLLAQTAWAQTPLTVKVKGGKENAFLLYAKEKLQKVEWKKVQDGSTTEKAYELTETIYTPQGTFKAASIFLEGESSTEYIVTLPESKDGYQNTFYGLRCTNPITVQSWGPTAWTSLDEAFAGAEVTIEATNSPNFATKSLRRMFAGSTLNSATLATWNVSSIEDFEGMFEDCQKFDVSLAKWNVRSARNMRRMFAGATAFSQSLATWGAKVQNVGNMEGMFAGAVAYNESLAHWQLSSCETLGIGGSGISAANYAASLKGWAANPSIARNITLDASGLCYADAASEHEKLAKEKKWLFVGDYSGVTTPAPGLKPFVTRWTPDFTGELPIPVYGKGMRIEWKNVTSGSSGTISGVTAFSPEQCYTLKVTSGNTYEVRVAPAGVVAFRMKEMTHKASLASVEKWGDVAWQTMHAAFYGCPNVTFASEAGAPNFTAVTDFSYMFAGCENFDTDLSSWDMSHATTLRAMFAGCRQFKSPLNGWGDKLRNVTDMGEMFDGCVLFNQPLSSWNVSAVRNMHAMFRGCVAFNQDLSAWWNKVTKVTDMAYLFAGCKAYNQSISTWNTQSVTTMRSMFEGATVYDQPVEGWNVEKVEDMTDIFSHTAFNQPLGSWKLAKCRNLSFVDAKFTIDNYCSSLTAWAAKKSELVHGMRVGIEAHLSSRNADETNGNPTTAHKTLETENHWDFQEEYTVKGRNDSVNAFLRPFQKSTVRVGEEVQFVFYYDKKNYNGLSNGYDSEIFTRKYFNIDEIKGKVTSIFSVNKKPTSSRSIGGYNYDNYSYKCYLDYTILDTNEEPLDPKPVTLSAPSEVMVFKGQKADVQVGVTTEAADKSVSVTVDGLQDPSVLARYAGGTSTGAKIEIKGAEVGEYLVRAYSTHNPAAAPAVIRVRVVPAFSFATLKDMTLKVGEMRQPELTVNGRLYSGAIQWKVTPDDGGTDLVEIAPNGAFIGKRAASGTIQVSSLVQPAVQPLTADITVAAAETGNALTLAAAPAGATITSIPAELSNLQAGAVVTIMVKAEAGKKFQASCPGTTLETLTENRVYQVTMGSTAATFTLVEAPVVTNALIIEANGYTWTTVPTAISALRPGDMVTLKITNPSNDHLTLTADNLEIVTVSPNRTYRLRMGDSPVTLKVEKYTAPTYTLSVNMGATGLTYTADKELTALHEGDKVLVTLNNADLLPVKHTVTAGVRCEVKEAHKQYEVTMPAGNVALSFEELLNAELTVDMGETGLTYRTTPAVLKHVQVGTSVEITVENSANTSIKCVHVETGNEVAATTKNKVFTFVMTAANATLRFEKKMVHSLTLEDHVGGAFVYQPADLTELASGEEVTFRLSGSASVPSDKFPFFKITAGSAQLSSPETNVFKVTMGDDDATLRIAWNNYLSVYFRDRTPMGFAYPDDVLVNGEKRDLERDDHHRWLRRVKTGDKVVIEITNKYNKGVDIDCNVAVESLWANKRYQFVVGEENVTFTMQPASTYRLSTDTNDGLELVQETSFDLSELRRGNEVTFGVTNNPENHLVEATITSGDAELTTLEANKRYKVKMKNSNVTFRVGKVFKTLVIHSRYAGENVNRKVPVNSVVTFKPIVPNNYLVSEDVTPELQSDGTYRFTMPNKDVTVYVHSPLQLYIDKPEGLEVTTDLDKENLRPGQTVTITVTNPEGKKLAIRAERRGKSQVKVPYTTVTSDKEYSLVMPDYSVNFFISVSTPQPIEVENKTDLHYTANKALPRLYTGDEVVLTIDNPENIDLIVAWERGRELESIEANKRYKFTVTEGRSKIIIRRRPAFYTLMVENPYRLEYQLMDSKGSEKNLKQCEAEEKLTLRLADAGDIAFLLSRSDDGAITLVKEKTEEDPWTVYEFTMPASALTVNIGIAVNTVSINKQRLDIWEGHEETLTATVYPERLNDRSVRWEVEDTEIATVDRFGSVHGVRKGHTTVKAISKADETKVAVCDVYVDTPQPLKSISFAVSSMKISFSKRPLQVLFTPRNFPNQRVTFSVKDSRIVSIDDEGYVKGLMKGKTEIYAESVANPSIKAKCTVEVIDEVQLTDIAFYKKQISLTVGATQKDLIDFTPLSATNKEVVWSIKDNSIVSVDRFGELTALRIGETEVSAQSVSLDKTITMKVIVTEFVRLESFSLSASSLKMKVGESKSLSVSLNPKNTTQRLIKWESSNAQVVSVSGGQLTAHSVGSATIYATCKEANKVQQCSVTVEPAEPKGVEDAALSQVRVAPNPFDVQLQITHVALEGATYELLSAAGQILRTGELTGTTTVVETADLHAGLYLLRIRVQNGASKTLRVVKL